VILRQAARASDRERRQVKDGLKLPLVPIFSSVFYPSDVSSFTIHLESTKRLLRENDEDDLTVAVHFVEKPGESLSEIELPVVGLEARVLSKFALPRDSYQVNFQGLRRIIIERIVQTDPYFVVEAKEAEAPECDRNEVMKLVEKVLERCEILAQADERYSTETVEILRLNMEDPGRLADMVAGNFSLQLQGRRKILGLVDVRKRLEALVPLLDEELKKSSLLSGIAERARSGLEESKRRELLKKQLEIIKAELGEEPPQRTQAKEYRARLESAPIPDDIKKTVRREVDRLSALSYVSQEYSETLTYLDWVFSLPWERPERPPLDVARVREVLDREHFGLSFVKDKIIEYLSVLKLKHDYEGPVLCLVGPTGTGKTSLARSVAEGLGRKFVEVNLQEVAADSELLGIDRNYVEAGPGKLVQALKEAGTIDPVLVLDGVDSLAEEEDKSTVLALCDILDAAKRRRFRDRYLGFPIDLSRAVVLCTASTDYDIPYLLEEKLDLVHLAGYTGAEKVKITFNHLLPARIEAHGLELTDLTMSRSTVRWLIHSYTREAGLKELTELLDALCKKRAAEKVAGVAYRPLIGRREIKRYLGPPRYPSAPKRPEVGVAMGLAWTATGGDLLIIEALKMRGNGELIATGQLGQVLSESIKAAHSYVRSRADMLGIPTKDIEKSDIHIHFPEGAIPKDGPSAGVAATLAIASILSGRPIRADVAVTGEVTLTGKVLAVGGIREKLMAAYRAGARKVIIPKQNEEDLLDVPEDVLKKLELVKIERMDEALKVALLEPEEPAARGRELAGAAAVSRGAARKRSRKE